MICKKCNSENSDEALFCSKCGANLLNTCPNCNYNNDINATYCIKCGKVLISNNSSDITCGSCGATNKANSKFCYKCGQKLTNICPKCNKENEINAEYCVMCGTSLTSKKVKIQKENKVKDNITSNHDGLSLTKKIIKIISFSICLLLMALTFGASFSNILTFGFNADEGTTFTGSSYSFLKIIDNIKNLNIDKTTYGTEYAYMSSLVPNIILLICVLLIMITSLTCLIISIIKIVKNPKAFVDLKKYLIITFASTLTSVLISGLMKSNVNFDSSNYVYLTFGGFILTCLILDFAFLMLLYISDVVIEIIETHNFKLITQTTINIFIIIFIIIGLFGLTNSIFTYTKSTYSYSTSIGFNFEIISENAYEYCNTTTSFTRLLYNETLSNDGSSFMTLVIISYSLTVVVIIALVLFFILLINKLTNNKKTFVNVSFGIINLVLSIIALIFTSITLTKSVAVTADGFESIYSYYNYKIGSAIVLPTVMFSVALALLIINHVITKDKEISNNR